jgi:nitrite reductase/ring-hydroxylating ferredoxin subunit
MTDVQPNTSATPDHVPSRRAVFMGVGAVGATAVLAACGTNTNPAGAPIPAGSANAPIPAGSAKAPAAKETGKDSSGGDSTAKVLAAVADVPSGGGVITSDLVITQPSDGTFKAFSNICTHAQCKVGNVKGGTINCLCHGSKFSIEDGSPQAGPANKALAETKVKVDGKNVVAA